MRLTKKVSVLVGAICAGLATLASWGGLAPVSLDGLFFDAALVARAKITRPNPNFDQPANVSQQVAIIAVDQRSLEAEEMKVAPRAMFSPIWAKLITGVRAANANTIAFDFLFSYSARSLQKGYDRPFMMALSRHRKHIVLGRSARSTPARSFMAAMRNDPGALGSMDVFPDGDEVHRLRRSRHITDDGGAVQTLTGAALARVGRKDVPPEILLTPRAHPEDFIPTYALVDVLHCASSDPETLKKALGGRMVFVGTTLPEEDRIVSTARFMKASTQARDPIGACALRPLLASVPASNTVPGVHLNAIAADAVLSGDLVQKAAPWVSAIFAAAGAIAGVAIGFLLAPVLAVFVASAAVIALWSGEIAFLILGWWTPMAMAAMAVPGAAIVAYVVRFVLEERRRRRVQNAFGHYLAPELVKQLADSQQDLSLGGEKRDITVMFADLSGFTALSGLVGPEELMSRTNGYLKLIADEVEATGGYVDKFIGDAVMAIWNAPVKLPDHKNQAVTAALGIGRRITERREKAVAEGEHGFAVKIGVNCGEAVVGNVGSEKRFNYTAVGEAVNIAARLESLPGTYDCQIVLSGELADQIDDGFTLRELDKVAVKGKKEPLRIFEPLNLTGVKEDDYAETRAAFLCYGDALALYRSCHFTDAAQRWAEVGDGPSLVMAARARGFAQTPPAEPWDGVWIMTTK